MRKEPNCLSLEMAASFSKLYIEFTFSPPPSHVFTVNQTLFIKKKVINVVLILEFSKRNFVAFDDYFVLLSML